MLATSYCTKTPKAFSQLISELSFEKILELQKEYEKFRGSSSEVIDIVFFKEVPGETPILLNQDVPFKKLISYQFSDKAVTKEFVQRQFLVTVEI